MKLLINRDNWNIQNVTLNSWKVYKVTHIYDSYMIYIIYIIQIQYNEIEKSYPAMQILRLRIFELNFKNGDFWFTYTRIVL